MVNTNVHCRSRMLIRNIWCWTLVSKVEVSASIYGRISTPLVPQQLTWWFKVHLRRKAHASRAMLISKLECWFAKFNVELSLIKLKSKVLKIALRTAKLNCKVECWSFASQMLHSQFLIFGGMELHGKRRSLFLTLIIILYSSTLHNGRVCSQDPVVIQQNYHWLHFLNWVMADAFWTVFGNLFKLILR